MASCARACDSPNFFQNYTYNYTTQHKLTILQQQQQQQQHTTTESGAVTTSTQCGHVFHRECIMGWILNADSAKDECPQCRQLMWEGQTYQFVEDEIRATLRGSSSPS